MPNLNLIGNRTQLDRTTKLRFKYDEYLSSLEAKHVFQKIEKKVVSNINEQKKVFLDEFNTLKIQLITLSDELNLKNQLKIEKKELDERIKVLEMLGKLIISICL